MDEGGSNRSIFSNLINRFVGAKKKITEEEVHDFIEATEEEGIVNEEESQMLRSILSLRTTLVREVMLPRTDMAVISADASIEKLIETIIECGHSRIPVYQDSIDNITGLIYAKDLLAHWGKGDDELNIRQIMRPPFFIPETKELEELLQEFKRKRVHLAIVIDEYGGTSGVVTIEDILEEIVGDIQDEFDSEEALFRVTEDGTMIADSRIHIEQLEKHFGIEIEKDKFDTLGGLIFHLTGKIPSIGDIIHGNYLQMKIVDADPRKIKKVEITKIEDYEENEKAGSGAV